MVTRKIPLTDGLFATIDEDDYELVKDVDWYAEQFKCSVYANARAKVKGRWRTLRMHRLIAKTPPRMVCHHLNHNTLDNRKCNLRNMTPQEHMRFHSNNSIQIKYE